MILYLYIASVIITYLCSIICAKIVDGFVTLGVLIGFLILSLIPIANLIFLGSCILETTVKIIERGYLDRKIL